MTDHLVDAEPAPPGDPRPLDDAEQPVAPGTGAGGGPAEHSSRWSRWRERRRNRVSKWDRPPPPKDWRYFVGGLGKIFIATGILMFGFVAYQLWGTGIETARAQNKLQGEFDEQVEAATVDDEPAVGIENWVVPEADQVDEPTVTDPAASSSADDGADALDEIPGPGDVAGDTLVGEPSPVVPGGVDLSNYAVDQNVRIIPDEAFARLEIPKIGTSHHVVPGVTLNDLKKGPGHYPSTPLPGQLGNASIAGHRTTYGAPFFNLDRLAPGDELIVTMITGDRFVYRVTGMQIVTAADSWVISTRDSSVAELTLTTCHPKYTARDRLVVHSVLVPEKSAQVGTAEFYDFDEPAEAPIPGDDPTFTASDEEPDTSLVDDTVAADAVTTETVPATEPADVAAEPDQTVDAADDGSGEAQAAPTTDAAAAEDTADEIDPAAVDPDDEEIDAFSQGWFDDRDAFPQIALWGSVLTLISLLAYQISKKTRHDSIGFLVGIAPFLIALYFFFQNVNRLLPPGL